MSAMLNNVNTNIERIIAKIDNDFNPDNSDWIPRVGAWCIDAMSQLDALRTVRKKRKVSVKDRIAYSDCPINNTDIKVYDSNGCEIKEVSDSSECKGCSSTGEVASGTSDTNAKNTSNVINHITSNTIDKITTGYEESNNNVVAETVNDKYPFRYNVHHYVLGDNNSQERNYVLVDCNKIELNFDADYIYVETEYIDTEYSSAVGCELPVIPNNGILIEAITYYCMYKMLCRGYKHQVFNLAASQYGTNPYYIWTKLKDEAKRSVINDNVGDASRLFRSALFIGAFDPRN